MKIQHYDWLVPIVHMQVTAVQHGRRQRRRFQMKQGLDQIILLIPLPLFLLFRILVALVVVEQDDHHELSYMMMALSLKHLNMGMSIVVAVVVSEDSS